MDNKTEFFKKIESNIKNNTFHINVVTGKQDPRYAYTIGNINKLNSEFILAGCSSFLYNDLIFIFNEFISKLEKNFDWREVKIEIPNFGNFKLSTVDQSWSKIMMIGVYDYFKIDFFNSYQIIPESKYLTLDTPNMKDIWSSNLSPIWRWIDDKEKWDLNIPYDSKVITNINALFGEKILEVMRWEDNEWEAFTMNGQEIDKKDIRIVPISTLLGIDSSLKDILSLEKGKGLWRDYDELVWQKWN